MSVCLNNEKEYQELLQEIEAAAKANNEMVFAYKREALIKSIRYSLFINKKGSCIYLPFAYNEVFVILTR